MNTLIPTVAISLAFSVTGCATGDDGASRGEATKTSTISDRATDVDLTEGTWLDEGVEFCSDWFPFKRCTASFPSPQCPSVVSGQPCPSVGNDCYVTLSATTFRRFSCI